MNHRVNPFVPSPFQSGYQELDPADVISPQIQKDQICCLDYSVAKEGMLVAYRWDGEKKTEQR